MLNELVKLSHGQAPNFIVFHLFHLSRGGIQPITTTPPITIITPSPATTSNSVVIINPTTPCQCTATANCADGSGTLNPRIVNNNPPVVCAVGQVYCCNLINPNPVTAAPTTIPPSTCGIRPNIANTFLPGVGQAAYAAYPWTALIFRVSDNALIGTGVLLDANTVLTAAHKVSPATQVLRVRLGEYIINAVTEPNPLVEIAVSAIRIHEAFNSVNLVNDIAVLKLATAIDFNFNPHIRSICLPAVGAVYSGQRYQLDSKLWGRCWTAGFGASSFASNQYQTTMREVDVPILDGPTCQARFSASRLGATFVFNQQSFICAGGETSRDACTGDGGAGLVCLTGTQWFLAGLVSWGLDCGQTNVPGAYVNIPNYLAWITTNRV
ncbi:Salivary plasminogen activator gamma [Orchesella cincta]|uniref:Salivary plasminogen activator gamma n=1 Tax=Orchesella cincta TaxID=48709 RepID=A0A1D2MMA3_ORCCI|nr:Salivary plasminogen activator gamma [Orchesella cincta]